MATAEGGPAGGSDVLLKAVRRQEQQLRAAQAARGEFDPGVSEDLAQLGLLYIMSGDLERALPLLHRRLVIHEKFGPEELVGETLQELGTVYRLHGTPEVARQHLTRALGIRKKCHGEKSLKVAETLNSLALVHQRQNDTAGAEELQLQSLQVLFENTEPEDMESEDVPWEIFKRLKKQRGPSTAANSVVLLKGNMRKAVTDILYKPSGEEAASPRGVDSGHGSFGEGRKLPGSPGGVENASASRQGDELPSPSDRGDLRSARSKSDSAMKVGAESLAFQESLEHALSARGGDSAEALTSRTGNGDTEAIPATPSTSRGSLSRNPNQQQTAQLISDFATLQQRVEHLKRRISAGLPDSDFEISQFASDVTHIASPELQQVADTMVSLVRELHRLRVRSDAARQLPILEGVLEKKSASIFRGWERRWFKVDPKTFVLSYHFSKDDDARGFAPRGGFAISRIASILVHRHPRGSFFHFDVVVDLSTRSNPHGSRTYELRCEDEDTLRYWVDTLHYYKTIAQSSPPRPSTG